MEQRRCHPVSCTPIHGFSGTESCGLLLQKLAEPRAEFGIVAGPVLDRWQPSAAAVRMRGAHRNPPYLVRLARHQNAADALPGRGRPTDVRLARPDHRL